MRLSDLKIGFPKVLGLYWKDRFFFFHLVGMVYAGILLRLQSINKRLASKTVLWLTLWNIGNNQVAMGRKC